MANASACSNIDNISHPVHEGGQKAGAEAPTFSAICSAIFL
jgi:hypothetical protein